MKNFIKSIFFYPVITLIIIMIGLFATYKYIIYNTTKTIISQGIREAQEDAYLLKNSIEDLSIIKKSTDIQRRVMLAATKQHIRRILLVSKTGKILYAYRYHFVGKQLEKKFEKNIVFYYHKAIKDNLGIQIHSQKNNIIDVIMQIDYLYNPETGTNTDGFLIMQYNLSPAIIQEKTELQKTMLWLFISISLLITIIFYIYYRSVIKKLLYIDYITSHMNDEMPKSHNHSRFLCLDDLIKNLTETTKHMAILARVFKCSSDSIIITDNKKQIIAVNPAFENVTGLSAKNVVGKTPELLAKFHLIPKTLHKFMLQQDVKNGQWSGEIIDKKIDGTNYTVYQTIFEMKDPVSHQTTHYVSITKDITDITQKQKEIEHLAYYDKLTGLINRSSFLNSLDKLIAQKSRKEEKFALIYIDLDNFKEINDTIGHEIGDRVLKYFSQRVQNCLRKEDIVARIGGDEFAIIIPDIETPEDALNVARKIIDNFKDPFKIGNKELSIGVSMGITIFPDDGIENKNLIAAADLAMNKAKEDGKNCFAFFETEMQKKVLKKFQIRKELEYAIYHDELFLHYQPKFDTQSEKINGFEALIRWKHPKRGVIPPYEFISIAENSALIVPMTEWIFKEVSKAYDRFKKNGYSNISIAINISAKHFQTKKLIELIKDTIQTSSLGYKNIELEVTESAVMENIKIAKEQLDTLHDLGIKVALDDYGTGHSSLAYLKHLPIDTLKIDKIFIDGIINNHKDRAIVNSTVKMAKSLGMKTVAEGVEDEMQANYIKEIGCSYIQGYFYSPPVDEESAMELLKQYINKQKS